MPFFTLYVILLLGCVRMAIGHGENDWAGSRKAEKGGCRCPNTREVRETMALTGLSSS